jgi:hypothetical protein
MDGQIFVNLISFWRVCQIKITHHWNFQNFDLYSIYLAFDSTLKSMGRVHIIQISLKSIIFSNKSFGRKLHTLSVYENYQLKLIIYHVRFRKFRFFSFLSRSDNSSLKSWVQKGQCLIMYHSCKFGLLYFCHYWTMIYP